MTRWTTDSSGFYSAVPRKDLSPANRLDHPFTLEGTKDGFFDHVASGTTGYFVTPPVNQEYVVTRLLIYGEDGNFSNAAQYGGGTLPTGIALTLDDANGDIIYNFTPIRIDRAYLWGLYAGVDAVSSGDAQADPLLVSWTFNKAGNNVIVNGFRGEKLQLHIPDNMGSGGAGLDAHYALVHGWIRDL